MRRFFSLLLPVIPITLSIVFFIGLEAQIITTYYSITTFILTLLNTVVCILFAYKTEIREQRKFFIVFSISMFIYLVDDIFDLFSLFGGSYPVSYFNNLVGFIAIIPILYLIINRLVRDLKLIRKESIPITIAGTGIASVGFVAFAVVVTILFSLTNDGQGLVSYAILAGLESIIMIMIVLLYILYLQLEFRYYWFVIFAGFLLEIISHVFKTIYDMFNIEIFSMISDAFSVIAFASVFVIILWIWNKELSLTPISQIEVERKQYKNLYLELDDKIKDLLILTQLLRHDLNNDIVVIANAIEIYEESSNKDLLKMAKKRIRNVEQKISKLKSSNEIYRSLAIREIPITFIEEVASVFEDVKVHITDRNDRIRANQLIYSIIFNFIQNAVRHGGDKVQISIITEHLEDTVIIRTIDNGIGISDELKQAIMNRSLDISEEGEFTHGQGLNLARTAIEGLGGTFIIEDNKPKGTIITIELLKCKTQD
ncbi:MAG: hypothetical protein KGD64_07905 [Candidatus Heimdallarchaeota archaeon]|nr:hypothetical protein [Candidatus Heimdallarchaeota archaeon]